MRPPILFLAVAFGVGLWAGLDPFVSPGAALWGVALPVGAASAWFAPSARFGAAIGVMLVAGMLWGGAALRERAATCEGRWTAGEAGARAAIVRLGDPAPDSGGPLDADVVAGSCGGALRLRWPDGIPAAGGGTTWVVAGRWVRAGERGVPVVRRAKRLDPEPRGRGAHRGRPPPRRAAPFGP